MDSYRQFANFDIGAENRGIEKSYLSPKSETPQSALKHDEMTHSCTVDGLLVGQKTLR